MDRDTIAPMFKRNTRRLAAALLPLALVGAGCGSSSHRSGGSSGGSPGGSSAEAKSAATGDIPDNQNFLTYTSKAGGWSMRYPEGWAVQGSGADVKFVNKNNVVHVVIAPGPAPTVASVATGLKAAKAKQPTLQAQAPTTFKVHGLPAIKATYTTLTAPDPVTGKRVTLIVDRYVLSAKGKVATVDLGTQKGVDNVDAYRMMIQSFRAR